MNVSLRLSLPIVLAVTAAVLNQATLQQRLQPEVVIGLAHDLERGQRISEGDLQPVEVPSNPSNTRNFWKWNERHLLLCGTSAAFKLKAGDLVPRDVFFRESKPRFVIPENSLVICLPLPSGLITTELRHRLRDGMPVSIRLMHEQRPVQGATLAFLEFIQPASEIEEAKVPAFYQVGLAVRSDSELSKQLLTQGLASIEPMDQQP